MTGVHHPRGDLQKFSRGDFAGFLDCSSVITDTFSCRAAFEASGKYLRARWSLGTVESGSSGSGLFASIAGSRYLVEPSGLNAYGRFDLAYEALLRRWLSPGPAATAISQAVSPSIARVPVHRFYNFATGAHFYTPIAAERDWVIANLPTYAYEGVAFYGYEPRVLGSYPVFRLYNRSTRRHFYTMTTDDRDAVLANPDVTDEGIGWYGQWGDGGTAKPVYRFYNASTGGHFYTISEVDKAIVLKQYPSFTLQGVGFHAWTTP